MNCQKRLEILINQMDLMRELLDDKPEYKDIAIAQMDGMVRYSRAIGDIDYNYEVKIKNGVRDYFNEPAGHRRPVKINE